MRKFYIDQKILLAKNLKIATIVKKDPNSDDKLIVSYYHDNTLVYDKISPEDIMTDEQYEVLKNRNNKISDILKD